MKITKSKLKQIIKEELEAVMQGEEDTFDDPILSLEPGKEIPSIFSQSDELNEADPAALTEIAVLSYGVGQFLALASIAGIMGYSFISKKVKNFFSERQARIIRQMNEQMAAEAKLLVELLTDDPVLKLKIEKYIQILDIVESNKGKRSEELKKIRAAKKPLSDEISRDIRRKIDEYVENIEQGEFRDFVKAHRKHRKGALNTRDVRRSLIRAIEKKINMPEATESPALSSDVLSAMDALSGESDRDRQRRAAASKQARSL